MDNFEPNTGMYAKVIADSVNPDGVRLVTIETCFERFLAPEFLTHRKKSRNGASSRAIPVKVMLDRVKNHPFVPKAFPVNKPGMSATEYIYPGCDEYVRAKDAWLRGRDAAVETAEALLELGVHKQTANRVLEPYMYITYVVTATDWDNFYNLRISPHAQPEFNALAVAMKTAMDGHEPQRIGWGGLHLPYVDIEERESPLIFPDELKKLSAGRCAAVTLLNQNKKDIVKDIARTDGLITNGHMSPLEHPALALSPDGNYADIPSNFDSTWRQYRKEIVGEAVYNNE